MTDETTWLTPAAYKKLQEELSHLQGDARHEISERIAEARSHGDIRENADYDAAKNEQGMMEARIRQIRHLLAKAEVREAKDTGKVEIGSIVTVTDAHGDTSEYFVAPAENRIPGFMLASPVGPLGKALLGARVDDEVSYEAPGGIFTMVVTGIRPFEG
ncbi:MAG: transcription elongation factor GreA [Acidimicrobiia bacterium]|nr:transcription elongation factor GreA [Acidimicrobiia bacterium]